MIVSYSRKFIFIKTRKTASTTVEAVLASGCGRDDVISKSGDEIYPGSNIPIAGRLDPAGAPPSARSRDALRAHRKQTRGARKRGEFYSHMPAAEIKARVDPAFWNEALKVTVERHPYEKAVSQTFYRLHKRNRHGEDFDEFLDRTIRKGGYAGFPMWSIDGTVVVDRFIRHEDLEAELRQVCESLGIAFPAELPRMKMRTRKDTRPAHEILSDEQKRIVYEYCKQDFEILGYER